MPRAVRAIRQDRTDVTRLAARFGVPVPEPYVHARDRFGASTRRLARQRTDRHDGAFEQSQPTRSRTGASGVWLVSEDQRPGRPAIPWRARTCGCDELGPCRLSTKTCLKMQSCSAESRPWRAHVSPSALGLKVGDLLDWPTAPLMFKFCDVDGNTMYVAEPD